SASLDVAQEKMGSATFFVLRQGIFMVLALIGAFAVFRLPVSFWQRTGHWWVLFAGFLLLAVLIPGIGRSVNGSQRWIRLGPINLQPSEIAKFCMVIYISGYLVRRIGEVRSSWLGVMKPIMPLAAFVILLYMEPDFGALVVLVGAVMGMIFLSGMKASQFFIVIGGVVGLLATFIGLEPYRLKRLQNFLDPWQDPFGAGYQLSQAQIAFGRGEWTGTGLGNSVQKLSFLPEAHTDFVFSVLAEETGLLGALTVL
ncbi:MAG: putative lipid II flippase FtsW, partial [Porticoccaceae bacterium]|nr:putative lipid II flippase FtsW [Porticoccaceae bacterium]